MKLAIIFLSVFFLTIIQACVWKCNGINETDVVGYYYPIVGNKTEYIHIKPDGTFYHFYASKEDTIRDSGNWDISKARCHIGLSNMRWPDREYFPEWSEPSYADFEWKKGQLKMNSDYLSFEKEDKKPEIE
ncbi:hypothetical protein [Fulvivirga ligni]|uniref:hypothetical protein n=1 Tax=Fulvivirga ligni TaxID=2904246 RepID=UPI001F38E352|nr:hypothetical protein [Fulvivirga ligni]UII20270.1 hypothetical protein LVD16_20725 [Fulvivirga ligni]